MSETRSLKGLRKKLKLEVLDGKRYIRKKRFYSITQYYFFDNPLDHQGLPVPVNKKTLHRYTPDKDIRKCLKKYLSKVLDL